MFDIVPNKNITLDSFDVHVASGVATIEIYYRLGSYLPHVSSQAGWILAGTATVNAAGANLPTRVPIGGINLIGGQTYGMYITHQTSGTLAYTNISPTGGMTLTGPDFTLNLGHGGSKWAVTIADRQWNGRIYYSAGAIGCNSTKVPIQVNTGLPPLVDAGISAVVNPVGSTPSGTPTPIIVDLKNFGANTLTSASIVWSLNNVIQDTLLWTGTLPYSQTLAVTLDTVTFAGGVYCIKSWTFLPNGVTDSVNSNDTASTCFNACMAGVYTIGPATSGTYDFNTFNTALSTLVASGICGHVVFDVYPGTYTEQLTIPQINGMDINNTVTFRGFLDSTQTILQHTATSTANWVVRLNGADYFRFEKLTMRALDPTNGRVVELINGAHYNRFSNCQLISAGTTSLSSAVIYDNTTLNHHNHYLNNYMKGGYYGLYIYGASTGSWQKGTLIKNNIIRGTFYYPINIYYADSVEVNGNLIDSITGAYSYGISMYYINNYYQVVGNTVRIIGTSGVSYGIRDYYNNYFSYNPNRTGTGLVANNMVSISGSTIGHYGLYAYYSNGTEYYHNTISVTGGSASYYTVYQYNTTSNTLGDKFINNIFSNTAGGYAAYFGTPASVVACDYNNFYTTASNFVYWNANHPTLAAFQTASGTNANSHNITPPYLAVHDLHLTNTLCRPRAHLLLLYQPISMAN
jgi:hypothetical protein